MKTRQVPVASPESCFATGQLYKIGVLREPRQTQLGVTDKKQAWFQNSLILEQIEKIPDFVISLCRI
jgi:hypothetical protein